jgi:hypothetical protein
VVRSALRRQGVQSVRRDGRPADRGVSGAAPSGPLWDAYKVALSINDQMQRLVVMPPGTPPAAIAALRQALAALNDDKDYAADAMTAMGFVPHYTIDPALDRQMRERLSIAPDERGFITAYMKKAGK